jgi:MFS family permease
LGFGHSLPGKSSFHPSTSLYLTYADFNQFGYHTSALNQIKAVLTCERIEEHLPLGSSFFPTCIQMSNFVFSFVTAIFTVGGLLGSLVANIVMDRLGRKGASQVTALFHVVGAALMCVSGSVTSLSFGR